LPVAIVRFAVAHTEAGAAVALEFGGAVGAFATAAGGRRPGVGGDLGGAAAASPGVAVGSAVAAAAARTEVPGRGRGRQGRRCCQGQCGERGTGKALLVHESSVGPASRLVRVWQSGSEKRA